MKNCALWIVAILQASAFWASTVVAENRALLIGVTGYPSHIGPLRGPANDVQIMWRLLVERGFGSSNIRVLADRLPEEFAKKAAVACGEEGTGSGCPLYENIARALDEVITAAKAGDYVVLYFSGHGTQVPDLVKRDEPDGLNEAFVPIDAGRWNASRREVEKLLIDDTVGDAIQKIRQKGAFVWALFDTCHAGDMVRGATDYAMPRQVAGRALGIPDSAYAEALKARPAKTTSPKKGSSLNLLKSGRSDGLVGFYAAQSDQLALELAFQEIDASGKPTQLFMGGFTNALRRALAREPNATYRQLAQQIVEIYGGLGADMPAPYFEGDLDKPVFSDKAGEPTWNARREENKFIITAGELDGLSEGAIVALLGHDSSGPGEAAVGYARVNLATVTRSEAEPIAYADKSALSAASSYRLRARLEQPGISGVLRVAAPPEIDKATDSARQGLAAIEKLRTASPENRSLAVDWVEAGRPADIHLRFANGRIWLLTQFGDWRRMGARQSPSIAIGESGATAKVLQDNLWRASRSFNLQRVAGGYRQLLRSAEGAAAKTLKVDVFLYRAPRASLQALKCPDPPTAQDKPPRGAVRISPANLAQFEHCDVVYVVMRNEGVLPMDVTLLYVDAEAQIQCFTGWGRARIDPFGPPGEVRDRMQAFRIVSVDEKSGAPLPVGRERLMVIGVEKPRRDAVETTFCHLAQPSLDRAKEVRARAGISAFETLMEQAGLATDPIRGFVAVGSKEANTLVMRSFSWNVKDLTSN